LSLPLGLLLTVIVRVLTNALSFLELILHVIQLGWFESLISPEWGLAIILVELCAWAQSGSSHNSPADWQHNLPKR